MTISDWCSQWTLLCERLMGYMRLNAMLGRTHSSKKKSLTTVHKSKLILPPQKEFFENNKRMYVNRVSQEFFRDLNFFFFLLPQKLYNIFVGLRIKQYCWRNTQICLNMLNRLKLSQSLFLFSSAYRLG